MREIVERRRWRALERIFTDSERTETLGDSIRVTARGLWVPTPLPVLAALLRATRVDGLFERRPRGRNAVLDAGAGDGRVLAALAYFEPELEVLGVESDEGLFHRAVTNLEKVKRQVAHPERLRFSKGDYRQVDTYESCGVRVQDIAFVINYPDGNQDDLERFVEERLAPGVKLCLLTHDEELRLSNLELTSKSQVSAPGASGGWHWLVYST